jgi:hypothetical protein
MKLQVVSTSKLNDNLYSVEFNDGILLDIEYNKGEVSGTPKRMCSIGIDSYFMKKGHFPAGHNLKKRLMLGLDVIKQRIRRYKRKKDVK